MVRYKLIFDGPVSNPISDLTTSKLRWNSVIFTPGSKYLVIDVKNFYLNNAMEKHEDYMINFSLIPKDIIDKYYPIYNKINGFLCVRVEKVFIQARIIAHMALMEHLRLF